MNTNTNEAAEFGIKAARAWKSSERESKKGAAFAIFALSRAWFGMTFDAMQVSKTGEEKFRHFFTLSDYVNETRKPSDITDKTCAGIRQAAIAGQLFGINDAETLKRVKPLIDLAMKEVAYLIVTCAVDPTEITISKDHNLVVPFVTVADEPSDDASLNDKNSYSSMVGNMVELDGKGSMSLAQLKRKASPPKDRSSQPATEDQSKNASVVASAKLVTSVLVGFNTSESDLPAFNKENEAVMWALHMQLVAYFADADAPAKKENVK